MIDILSSHYEYYLPRKDRSSPVLKYNHNKIICNINPETSSTVILTEHPTGDQAARRDEELEFHRYDHKYKVTTTMREVYNDSLSPKRLLIISNRK